MIANCFRPLTGINFNLFGLGLKQFYQSFPSPHGDKLQLKEYRSSDYVVMFPSPHGDKFQQKELIEKLFASRFRPLTGINFNRDG